MARCGSRVAGWHRPGIFVLFDEAGRPIRGRDAAVRRHYLHGFPPYVENRFLRPKPTSPVTSKQSSRRYLTRLAERSSRNHFGDSDWVYSDSVGERPDPQDEHTVPNCVIHKRSNPGIPASTVSLKWTLHIVNSARDTRGNTPTAPWPLPGAYFSCAYPKGQSNRRGYELDRSELNVYSINSRYLI